MLRRRGSFSAALAITALTIAAAMSLAQESSQSSSGITSNVEAEADRALKELSAFLQQAKTFSFHIETTIDTVQSSGEKIQLSMSEDVTVKRPGSIRVDVISDEHRGAVCCDGQTFVFYDSQENTYAKTAVPNELGAAIDHVWQEYAIEVPVADFVYPDPYAVLMEYVYSGRHVGKHLVNGVMCDHLAFTQETIDWQIWIQEGPQRMPLKMVITYKQRVGEPQYTAVLSQWVMNPTVSDHIFRFDPPEAAEEIEFITMYDLLPDEGEGESEGGEQ